MPGKIKVNFKMPPETAAEKMHRRQQELRKKSGLPDPSHYKNLAAQKQKEIDAMKNEETELLDEMPESSMKTRDVHAHLKKSGWSLKRTGGGHDVYAHPKSKEHIAVPRHKQLKAPLIRGIMKASRVSEEVDIEEQLEKKGRFVSGPPKKTFKASTIVSAMREAKDPREYDYEGDMAMSQLRSLMFNAQDMMDLMEDNTNLPEWVQSKITLAEDYISTAANYLRGELNEEVNMNESGGDVVFKKGENHIEKYGEDSFALYKDGKKQKYYTTIDAAKSAMKEDIGLEEASKYAKMFDKMVKQRELNKLPKPPKSEYERKVDKYLKKKYQKEEAEIQESDAAWAASQEKRKEKKLTHNDQDKLGQVRALMAREKEAKAKMKKEDVELDEENKPTNPELWSKAKSLAKSKFDVYPSAYANGWAAKKYKEMGGSWKSVKEETEKPASRKAQIVKDIMKNKKNQDETSDKYQKDPEISSEIQKN